MHKLETIIDRSICPRHYMLATNGIDALFSFQDYVVVTTVNNLMIHFRWNTFHFTLFEAKFDEQECHLPLLKNQGCILLSIK